MSLPCPVLAIGGHRGILFALAPCPPRHLCSLLFLLPVAGRRKRTALARGPLRGSLGFELCHQSQGRLRREGRNPASLCCWGRAGCGPSPPGSTPQRGTLQPRALISPVLFPSPAPARGGQEAHGTVPVQPPVKGWELGRAKGAGVLPPPPSVSHSHAGGAIIPLQLGARLSTGKTPIPQALFRNVFPIVKNVETKSIQLCGFIFFPPLL